MKKLFTGLLIALSLHGINAQNKIISEPKNQESFLSKDNAQFYRIFKTGGGNLTGEIITENKREILLKTHDGREIYIPQHSIKKIEKLDSSEFNRKGEFIGNDPFSTRYFVSTNGFALEEGDNYIVYNWWGPELQFGLKNNFSVGVMSTWVGAPIIGTFKKSWEIEEDVHAAVGCLVGTGSYGNIDVYGALPFATLTFGDETKNISISSGYGAVSYNQEQYNYDQYYTDDFYDYYEPTFERVSDKATMFSVSGLYKVSKSISVVFESFFVLPDLDNLTLDESSSAKLIGFISPGIRFHQEPGKAFQIGFAGSFVDDIVTPLPVPMLQWYRTF